MYTLTERWHALLRWSERYTKTDMVYLMNGGFWLSLGSAVGVISTFVLSLAYANLLPKEVYGEYKYVLAIVGILSAFTLTELGTAVTQAVARGYEGIFKRSFWINLRWSAFMITGALSLAGYYVLLHNYTLAISFFIVAIFNPILTSGNLYSQFLYGKKDFKRSTLYYAICAFVPASVLIGTMFFYPTAMAIIAVYFIANTLCTLWCYRQTLTTYVPNDLHDEHAITYSKHLSLMDVLLTISDNIDNVIAFHFFGAAELAVYSFATALPEQTKRITKSLYSLMLPKFSERSEEDLRATMAQKMFRFLIMGLTFTILYFLAAPVVFKIFYPQYTDAIFLSQIYGLSLIGTTFAPVNIFLIAKRKIKEQYVLSITSALFQLFSLALFAYFWGLLGLIIARTVTRFFSVLVAYVLYWYKK
jgi:O-antigen/teichoic acid export membrane protein